MAAAARKCGVHRTTVYAKLADPEFRREYDAIVAARLEALKVSSVAASEAAYSELSKVLDGSIGISTAEKLRAAEIALRNR